MIPQPSASNHPYCAVFREGVICRTHTHHSTSTHPTHTCHTYSTQHVHTHHTQCRQHSHTNCAQNAHTHQTPCTQHAHTHHTYFTDCIHRHHSQCTQPTQQVIKSTTDKTPYKPTLTNPTTSHQIHTCLPLNHTVP